MLLNFIIYSDKIQIEATLLHLPTMLLQFDHYDASNSRCRGIIEFWQSYI